MPRDTFNIELSQDARASIEGTWRKLRMPKKEMLQRILGWYGQQSESVQQAILGTLPDDVAPDVARIVMERLARGKPPPRVGRKAV